MANTLTKMFGRTIIHADTDDGAITLAEMTATGEGTVTGANIVEIFYNIPPTGAIEIDRGGTSVYKIVGNANGGAHLVGHVDFQSAGIVLRGTNTADIGLTFTNFTNGLLTLIVHKEH